MLRSEGCHALDLAMAAELVDVVASVCFFHFWSPEMFWKVIN
jgi:hypothetical protein